DHAIEDVGGEAARILARRRLGIGPDTGPGRLRGGWRDRRCEQGRGQRAGEGGTRKACGNLHERLAVGGAVRSCARSMLGYIRHCNKPHIMPELPEVETTRRGIAPHVVGRRIARLTVYDPRLRWPVPDSLPRKLKGRSIDAIERRSKYLLFR